MNGVGKIGNRNFSELFFGVCCFVGCLNITQRALVLTPCTLGGVIGRAHLSRISFYPFVGGKFAHFFSGTYSSFSLVPRF